MKIAIKCDFDFNIIFIVGQYTTICFNLLYMGENHNQCNLICYVKIVVHVHFSCLFHFVYVRTFISINQSVSELHN